MSKGDSTAAQRTDGESFIGAQGESFIGALRALLTLVASVLEAKAGEFTLLELRALLVIAESTPCRSVDIAVALSIDPSTASRLCTRLESRRIITAQRSRHSKREVQISLTKEGDQLLDDVLNSGLRELRRSFDAFDRVNAMQPDDHSEAG